MLKHVELECNKKVLRGYLTMPEEFNGTIVVCFHGFTGNKTEHAGHFRNLSRLLEKENVATLRLDFSGNGESDGEFRDFTFDTMFSEAQEILKYARKIKDVKKLILLGFSMGGALAATIASQFPKGIDKLVLWSPAGYMDEMMRDHFEKGEKLENGNSRYSTFEISKEMYESVNKWHPYEGLENYPNKVLIIQGKKDLSVPFLCACRYAASFKDSHLYFIDEAGHGYDALKDQEKLYKLTIDFIKN